MQGLRSSRLMAATPYEILRFIGRGTSLRDYQRLKAALDRLQSTSVATSHPPAPNARRLHRFSWINEWKERADGQGRPLGIELILPDWFYAGVLDESLVLTIDANYFRLTGGIERWLYRLVRKHGGRQRGGWRFDFPHLHRKSGSLARFTDFAYDLRCIVRAPAIAGLHARHLAAEAWAGSVDLPRRAVHGTAATRWQLRCRCSACGKTVNPLVLSGVEILVLSGAALSCYQEYEQAAKPCAARVSAPLNLVSNFESIKLTIRRARALWINRRRRRPAHHDHRAAQPERRGRQNDARHAHCWRAGDARQLGDPARCRSARFGTRLDPAP